MSDLQNLLKFLHVLAAVVWVGGSVLVLVFGIRLGTDPNATKEQRITFTKNAVAAGTVFTIAALAALAFGGWLVADVGYDWGDTWITIGFAGIAVGAALGMGFYGPQSRRLLAELESDDPTALKRGRRISMVSAAETLLLIVVVWAMVFKPGA